MFEARAEREASLVRECRMWRTFEWGSRYERSFGSERSILEKRELAVWMSIA